MVLFRGRSLASLQRSGAWGSSQRYLLRHAPHGRQSFARWTSSGTIRRCVRQFGIVSRIRQDFLRTRSMSLRRFVAVGGHARVWDFTQSAVRRGRCDVGTKDTDFSEQEFCTNADGQSLFAVRTLLTARVASLLVSLHRLYAKHLRRVAPSDARVSFRRIAAAGFHAAPDEDGYVGDERRGFDYEFPSTANSGGGF